MPYDWKPFLLFFASFVVVILTFICLNGGIFCVLHWVCPLEETGVVPAVAGRYELTEEGFAEGDRCAICLEAGGGNGRGAYHAVLRGCRHQFHQSCIDQWINEKRGGSCPLCRGTGK